LIAFRDAGRSKLQVLAKGVQPVAVITSSTVQRFAARDSMRPIAGVPTHRSTKWSELCPEPATARKAEEGETGCQAKMLARNDRSDSLQAISELRELQ